MPMSISQAKASEEAQFSVFQLFSVNDKSINAQECALGLQVGLSLAQAVNLETFDKKFLIFDSYSDGI